MDRWINGSVLYLCARRVPAEEVIALPISRWSDRPGDKPASAVGADIAQDSLDASGAKRAFVAANTCIKGRRRQRSVAVFAGRPELQHRYSTALAPEPPISFGTSFIFGNPSLIRSLVS